MNPATELPNDPLDDIFKSGSVPLVPAKAPPASYNGGLPEGKPFEQSCPKCRGSGVWRGGQSSGSCFKCKGTGKLSFKTAPEARAKAKASNAARKQSVAAAAIEDFKIGYPEIWDWMDGNAFGFAVAMRDAVVKWGGLTEGQLDACRKCVEKLAAAKVAKVERVANAPAVNVTALEEAFAKAAGSQKRAPKLYVNGMKIYPAKADSQNAGALYVCGGPGYLGKVLGGKFFRSRECTTEMEAVVLAVLADPKGMAIKHGILTKECSVCGITLTDPDSIAAGIGPICATKFGW